MNAAPVTPIEVDPPREGGVGQTSLLIAAWRAGEAEQIEPLFVDPMANVFVTPAMAPWIERITRASVSTRQLICYRTRYFDDTLRSELARGVRQIVLLGSGLDTRALRLGHPEARFYEVDCREVLTYKRARLEQHGYTVRSQFVEADYIRDDVLALLSKRGFQPEEETYFIWEGNTMYLPAEAIVACLRRLRGGVARFRISFDYLSDELIARRTGFEGARNLVSGFESIGAPWVTGFGDIQRVADAAGLNVVGDQRVVDVVPPTHLRVTLDRELFRHYSVCTLSSHE